MKSNKKTNRATPTIAIATTIKIIIKVLMVIELSSLYSLMSVDG